MHGRFRLDDKAENNLLTSVVESHVTNHRS